MLILHNYQGIVFKGAHINRLYNTLHTFAQCIIKSFTLDNLIRPMQMAHIQIFVDRFVFLSIF